MMYGPQILVSSMSVAQPRGPSGDRWQYHSRSDLHSKVACWGALFDLLRTSSLLRSHAASGKVVLGVNFRMVDFGTGRKKNLDLVVARASSGSSSSRSLADLADRWAISISDHQRKEVRNLPDLLEGNITGTGVCIAIEAKAAMTAHSKARPRLYDELNSSHLTIHGASPHALAVGLAMVNAAPTFISPELQSPPSRSVVSAHKQPDDAARVVAKLKEIPRRTSQATHGFDGLGVVIVDVANDGSPVRLVTTPPAPQPGDIFHYDDMIARVSNEYDTRFKHI